MKFKVNRKEGILYISFSKSLFAEQVATVAAAAGMVLMTFWFAPEQMGWLN